MRKKHRMVPLPRPAACLALVLLALTPGALRADETTRPDHVSESKAPDITFGDINPRSASHGESQFECAFNSLNHFKLEDTQ